MRERHQIGILRAEARQGGFGIVGAPVVDHDVSPDSFLHLRRNAGEYLLDRRTRIVCRYHDEYVVDHAIAPRQTPEQVSGSDTRLRDSSSWPRAFHECPTWAPTRAKCGPW